MSEDRERERRQRCARRRSATPRRGGREDGGTCTASVRARRLGDSARAWPAPETTYGGESGNASAGSRSSECGGARVARERDQVGKPIRLVEEIDRTLATELR